jgi:hypothetical protein
LQVNWRCWSWLLLLLLLLLGPLPLLQWLPLLP